MNGSSEPFRTFLEAQRAVLVRGLARKLATHIEGGENLAETRLLELADISLALFLDALGDRPADVVARWANEHFPAELGASLELEPALQSILIARRYLTRCAQPAVETRVEGAWDGLLRWGELCDDLTVRSTALVQRQLHSVRDELKQALARDREPIDQALRESEERYRNLVETAPEGMLIQRGGRIIYVNAAATRMLGAQSPAELLDKQVFDIVHPDYHEMVKERIQRANQTQEVARLIDQKYVRVDGQSIDVEVRGVPITYEGGPAIQIMFRDIGERMRIKEALRKSAMQEERIRHQEADLRALSTPLIPLTEKVVLMPLIGKIDTRRANQILETLLEGIVTHSAAMAILDVTGVPAVDSQVAEGLRRLTQAVKLLGAEVVLTGIQPATARALVELGADLTGVVTHGTLRSGIAYALGQAQPRG